MITVLHLHCQTEASATQSSFNNRKPPLRERITIDFDLNNIMDLLRHSGESGADPQVVGLSTWEMDTLCDRLATLLLSQPMLLELQTPITIVGDTLGQFDDIDELFLANGSPTPDTRYLFLGNYTSESKESLATALFLFCYKLKYPENLFLLRGSQDCVQGMIGG